MFSPVKAIVGGALVFAIGGALLVAQPFHQQDTVPGAEAEVEGESTGVTGTTSCRPKLGGDLNGASPPFVVTDIVLTCTENASDPRVSGTSTVAITIEGWGDGLKVQDPANSITWNDYTLDGPEGTWSGQGYGFYDAIGDGHLLTIATGSGAYEGLTYVQSFTVPAGTAYSKTVGLIQSGSPLPALPAMALPSPASG